MKTIEHNCDRYEDERRLCSPAHSLPSKLWGNQTASSRICFSLTIPEAACSKLFKATPFRRQLVSSEGVKAQPFLPRMTPMDSICSPASHYVGWCLCGTCTAVWLLLPAFHGEWPLMNISHLKFNLSICFQTTQHVTTTENRIKPSKTEAWRYQIQNTQ